MNCYRVDTLSTVQHHCTPQQTPSQCTPRCRRPAQVRSEYVSVLSKVLAAHFKTYLAAIEKLQVSCAGTSDVLGVPDAPAGVAGSVAGVAAGVGSSMLSMFSKATGGNTQRARPVSAWCGVWRPAFGWHGGRGERRAAPALLTHRSQGCCYL